MDQSWLLRVDHYLRRIKGYLSIQKPVIFGTSGIYETSDWITSTVHNSHPTQNDVLFPDKNNELEGMSLSE